MTTKEEDEKLRRQEQMAHKGDPCKWCKAKHDDVQVGECPALEWRLPREGEFYVNSVGKPLEAMFDHEQDFTAVIKGYKDKQEAMQ